MAALDPAPPALLPLVQSSVPIPDFILTDPPFIAEPLFAPIVAIGSFTNQHASPDVAQALRIYHLKRTNGLLYEHQYRWRVFWHAVDTIVMNAEYPTMNPSLSAMQLQVQELLQKQQELQTSLEELRWTVARDAARGANRSMGLSASLGTLTPVPSHLSGLTRPAALPDAPLLTRRVVLKNIQDNAHLVHWCELYGLPVPKRGTVAAKRLKMQLSIWEYITSLDPYVVDWE